MAVKIIVMRTGDAVAEVAEARGQYSDLIRETTGDAWSAEWVEHETRSGHPLPSVHDADAFVITGSGASVTERLPWMLRLEAWIREAHAAKRPIFGICFGHQIVAKALGGEVEANPRGREMGTTVLEVLESDPIFEGLPERFAVNMTHMDTVVRLPEGAVTLARTDLENTGAYRIGDHIRCVQYHPELDGPAMREYVEARRERVEGEGLDADAMIAGVVDGDENGRVLKNFAKHFVPARE